MDFALVSDPANDRADLAVAAGDLVMDGGLATAVMISLGTDRLAAADDSIPDGSGNRRGWWGDLPIDDAAPDNIGSRLWLLRRAKATPATQRLAEQYIREALAWMIDDGVAGRIDVETALLAGVTGGALDRLFARVTIVRAGPRADPIYATEWSVTLAG